MSTAIAMIPARMGSQRLRKKNLRQLGGEPLISRAIRKCQDAGVFDEIWVNSEDREFEPYARQAGVDFHHRPAELASNTATSEDFVYEFLQHHDCDRLFQVHSIAPLLTADEVRRFVTTMQSSAHDVLLSGPLDQIECMYQNQPVNFSFAEKTNSQDLQPIQRVTWAITGWTRSTYIAAYESGRSATYAGDVGFFPLSQLAGHVIKTEADLQLAERLLPLLEPSKR